MKPLSQQRCEACNSQSIALTEAEITRWLTMLSGWTLADKDGVLQLCKIYRSRDFATALIFTRQVGALAEENDHHPAILLEWGKVEIRWWTHAVKGLHINDFILAAKTDNLILPLEA